MFKKMTSGDSRAKISETAPRSFEECYGLYENFADGDQSLLARPQDAEQYGSWQQFRLFPSQTTEMSYGAYASFGLEVTNTKIDGGEQAFEGGYEACCSPWIDDAPLDWRLPYPCPSRRSRSPYSDSDGSQYSCFSDASNSSTSLTVPHTRPAPIGSRGREMSQYQWRGRGADTAGTCRAKSRGSQHYKLGGAGTSDDFQTCTSIKLMISRGAFNAPNLRSNSSPACRGTKRFLMAPGLPCKFVKKQRVVGGTPKMYTGLNLAEDGPRSSDRKDGKCKEAVEERRVRVREKRRRRREKNCEKYGDKHRLAFTCAFCKFRTFEDKDIEKHFGSSYHQETLDYIRRHAKFDDRAINFLHDCMVHKFRKTVSALRKLRTLADQKTNQKVMEGVTEDDYMRKVEVVHCMACETYIPVVYTAVQQHLSSPLHLKSKVAYNEQLKRESVLTAKAIINNDSVKVRYEKYIKGEDPFITDTKEMSSDSSGQDRPDEPEDDQMESSDEKWTAV